MLAAMANGLFDVGKLQSVIGAALRYVFFSCALYIWLDVFLGLSVARWLQRRPGLLAQLAR